MPEYEVILTPDAQYDLDELENYIATKFHAPDIAEQYVDDILYILVENEDTVYVQNVIYQKRDIPSVLNYVL